MAKKLKQESRSEFVSSGDNLTFDEVRLGAILRIADATEAMAQNFVKLQNERDMWKRESDRRAHENASLSRQITSLKGVITKLRKAAHQK